MSGIDLKMTTEDAMRRLGEETKSSIEHIRRTGEVLAEELSASFKARAEVSMPNVATATAAAIIDFSPSWNTENRVQLNLALNGQNVGYADLARGLPAGRYRALITIERLGDRE